LDPGDAVGRIAFGLRKEVCEGANGEGDVVPKKIGNAFAHTA